MNIFLGIVTIVFLGLFIKRNYERYVLKTGEDDSQWMLLYFALASAYGGYWL